ncbi:hypothetical protein BBJ28_00015786 [Nothophytophthora sp. Chile5]|nr:hypothetical protein BBJ28_00015786 [Nothophytophthora sp. Chile5]
MELSDDGDVAAVPPLAGRVGPGNIRSLILEKEKELHDINEYRIRTLEALLRDKETAASGAKQQLSKLQEDFKYNLKLLEGRDEELALYDANFASLKNVLRDRETENSELRAREAELQAELQRIRQRTTEQDALFQQKLKDARAQMEGARWKFDDELRRLQDAMETQRRAAERSLREKDEDVETQRRELTVTFDDVMRQRESEFKRVTDDLQTKARDLELKHKAMAREGDAQRARAEELKLKNENLQQLLQETDKESKTLEWTLADVRAAKDTKVGELEKEVAALNEVKQKLLDEYESKMAELLQSLQAVEKAFVQQKTQFDDELQRHSQRKESELQAARAAHEAKLEALATKLRESEERADALQAELKQAKWDADDRILEKEREMERARGALQDLEDEQQRAAHELQQQLRAGDRESQTLQERLQDALRQVAALKEKEKTQRQELLESAEKHEELQRELVTCNLRWENRWQDQQQELEERNELRIRELQQVKDRLLTEKQAVEERLLHAESDVQRLRSELSGLKASARVTESFGSQFLASEAARAAPSPLWSDDPGTLSPVPGMTPLLSESPQRPGQTGGSVEALEMENVKLRDVIRQMKDALAQQAQEGQTSPDRAAAGVLELESCRRELGETQRLLEDKAKRVIELEARVVELEAPRAAEPELQSGRVAAETQVADLNRKLQAANSDIDRLVRERSQLMELSNQLRSDLRRSGAAASASSASTPPIEFAGKKDYENLIAELTQSLEDARIHNKTLKKELRRMVKLQVQTQQGREVDDVSAGGLEGDEERRRSSTLSMMRALGPAAGPPTARSSKRGSATPSLSSQGDGKQDLDEQLLALARNKRPSAREQAKPRPSTTRTRPSTISEHASEGEVDASALDDEEDGEAEDEDEEQRVSVRSNSTRSSGRSPVSRLFQPTGTTATSNSSAKVTDARLKLQQAKEMLLLSGKRAPIGEGATRARDRETSSQRTAVSKLKQLQAKRAEMVTERKKVRNYSLAS